MKLPNVNSKYGAPMGRGGHSLKEFLREYAGLGKVSLARVAINQGGYDNGGAYWGTGEPLWLASFVTSDGCDTVETFFRAPSRDAAKALLPGARFYR